MNFAGFIAQHSRSIVLVAVALAIAGVVSAISLPVGLFPQVSFPRVVVDLEAGSRPSDQMALLVTRRSKKLFALSSAFSTCAPRAAVALPRSPSILAGGGT